MNAQVELRLQGPMDHLRIAWQTAETLLATVPFEADPEGTRYNIVLALQELLTNVLRHGYDGDDSQPIELRMIASDDRFVIELRDQAPPFDPRSHRDVERRRTGPGMLDEGGYGIRIVRMVMDEMDYRYEGGWNVLTVTKLARTRVPVGAGSGTSWPRKGAMTVETRTAVLDHLPGLSQGELCCYLVGAGGEVERRTGPPEQASFRVVDGALEVTVQPDRSFRIHAGCGADGFVVLTYDAAAGPRLAPFLDFLIRTLQDKERVELDMESMYSSSLALLEEVAMVHDMLPRLASAEDVVDAVRMALEALLVASSVDRAIYVGFDRHRRLAEVLVEVAADERAAPIGPSCIHPPDGLVRRAIASDVGAILVSVPADGVLGRPGSLESFARRQVIGVPVRYGAADEVTLGACFLMDKHANTWSTTDVLGSSETKLAHSVALVLGAVLGAREVAELGKEMDTAQAVQRQILPLGAPELEGYELAGRCTTSGAVGGDYFDFIALPDGRTLVVIGDVSGHNLASGMVMVSARTSLRVLASTSTRPGEVFDRLARSLYEDLTRTERFITATGVAVRPGDPALEIVGAGHNPTLLYRAATGTVEAIECADTVLGFLPEPRHAVQPVTVESGDVVVLYTDGVTEAVDVHGEMFGEARLRAVLARAATGGAEEILAAVFEAIAAFADKTDMDDDASVVVLKAT